MHITAALVVDVVLKTALVLIFGYFFLVRPLVRSFKKVRDSLLLSGEKAAALRRQQHNERIREQQERVREQQAQEEERRLARNARQRERRAAQRARAAQESEAAKERKGRKPAAQPVPKLSNDGPKSWLDRLVEDDDTDGV